MLDFGLMVAGKPSSRLICLREKPTDRFLLKEVDPGKLPIVHRVEMTRDKDGVLQPIESIWNSRWMRDGRESTGKS